MSKDIAIDNPPHRPASASLAFSRESYGHWLYLARRTSIPREHVQTPAAEPATPTRTARDPAIKYFD